MNERDIFHKNPHILSISLDNEFILLVNPYLNNGIKILNKKQIDVYNRFDGDKDIAQVAKESKELIKDIQKLATMLIKKDFLVYPTGLKKAVFNELNNSINFWVHTTDSCNLRCRYCYIQTKDKLKHIEAPVIDRFILKIIETVRDRNLKLVTLRLAGGEPFIRFDIWKSYIFKLREELEHYKCKLNVVFLTNLTLLTDKIIEFIKSESIGIGVSLDGLKQFQDIARPFSNGRGSFDVILKNLERLIINGIKPHIMTVVSNDNLDGLFDFTIFLVKNNLSFRYSIVQSHNFNYQKATRVFDKIYSYLETEVDKGYSFTHNHKLGDLKLLDIYNHTCGAGINTGAIYSDGSIYFCQQQIGLNDNLGTIYSNQDLVDILKKGASYDKELSADCQSCNYLYICTGGCPLIRIDGKSPSCEFYKKFIPIIYKLIGKERLFKIRN